MPGRSATQAALSEGEALLRVALLVAHADGHEGEAELRAAGRSLRSRIPDLDAVQVWDASHAVATTPAAEVLADVARALTGAEARGHAFRLACEVAKADGCLTWDETRQMVALARGLRLDDANVQRIAAACWG